MLHGGEKPRDKFPMRETIHQAARMLPHRNVFGQAGVTVVIATMLKASSKPRYG